MDFPKDISLIDRISVVPTILDVVCTTTGMGFAAVARVTEDRWIACSVLDKISFGLKPGGELQVETTICHDIRQNREAVIIDHVDQDEAYRYHATPLMYGFQSYISMPIILPTGKFFGTLCAIDPAPAKLKTPAVIGMFKLFAELLAFHIDAAEKLESTEKQLAEEIETSELREQFIAILGHDLRNPLGAISAGAGMLERSTDPQSAMIAGMMKSSVTRMSDLIEDVTDFTRGRLGGGIALSQTCDASIEPVLEQVIGEMRSIWPGRRIDADISVTGTSSYDRNRMAQLFTNLIGNALKHGKPDEPVRISASQHSEGFDFSVANASEPIPASTLDRLFQPFFRATKDPMLQGLGLGLYIASEIAKAHGGLLEAHSDSDETRFTFRM